MIAFICLFIPAVLAVWLFESLSKTSLSRKQWLYRYCANNLFINLLCFAVKKILLDTAGSTFFSLYADTTPAAALNYILMAVPVAVVLVFVQVLLSKYVKVDVEEKTHGE